jgi:hypothetical protein
MTPAPIIPVTVTVTIIWADVDAAATNVDVNALSARQTCRTNDKRCD